MITRNQLLKNGQITGKTNLSCHTEGVPPYAATFRISSPIAQNQGQGTDGPEEYPNHLFGVTGSFRKRAAKIIVTIGIVVVMIDASTGEVSDKPKVKHP